MSLDAGVRGMAPGSLRPDLWSSLLRHLAQHMADGAPHERSELFATLQFRCDPRRAVRVYGESDQPRRAADRSMTERYRQGSWTMLHRLLRHPLRAEVSGPKGARRYQLTGEQLRHVRAALAYLARAEDAR